MVIFFTSLMVFAVCTILALVMFFSILSIMEEYKLDAFAKEKVFMRLCFLVICVAVSAAGLLETTVLLLDKFPN